jgi:NAD(P)-dependent dehydrogenase (short-subunit alcohol dehydrogenase family)
MANHWLVNLVLPEMTERKDGSIIIVSSIGGLRGHDTLGAYCISKAADLQLVRNLAVEHGQHNVRVNAISPGGVYNGQPEEFLHRISNLIPLGRMADVTEYQCALLFLCSDASSYMTGSNLVIDGGRSCW